MIFLRFEGGGEIVVLNINREEKKFSIASSKTEYEMKERPWKELFDKEGEEEQTEKLGDREFKEVIVNTMKHNGYELKNA